MTNTTNPSVPDRAKTRSPLAAVGAFLQSLESASFDYTLGRIERLEREVARLQAELRESRDPSAAEAHDASAATPEH